MNLIKKILLLMWPEQVLEKTSDKISIQIRTNKRGVVEVVDVKTGRIISNVSKIHLYVNGMKKVCAEISIKNVQLDLELEHFNTRINYENTNRND